MPYFNRIIHSEDTKNVTIYRYYSGNDVTLGVLIIDGVREPLFTLENPWMGNKIGLSCIPPGKYLCKPFSGQLKKDVYIIQDVAERSYILFHIGNYVNETKGCILIGKGVDTSQKKSMLISSQKAMKKFRSIIGNNEFRLEIIS